MTQHILKTHKKFFQLVLNAFKAIGAAIYKSQMARAMRIANVELVKYNTYKKTFNELNMLTDKELHDIGLTRCMIHSVAVDFTQKDVK